MTTTSPRGYYRYQRTDSDIENYQSVSVTSITLMLPIKTIMSFLKVLTYFITSISSHPVVLSDSLLYLVMMSVSTLITPVIL
jgi:hypothetical protein